MTEGDPQDYPRTTAALKQALGARGIRPHKRFGQCFLTDRQAVDAIVRDAEVTAADHVVEVGTGPGLLTHALCETGAAITSIELDEVILGVTRDLRAWPDRVRFLHADALAGKRHVAPVVLEAVARPPAVGGRRRFVSNLPYNIATPLVLGLLAASTPPEQMTVMVQLEVAEKLLARPGDGGFGVPSVLCGLQAEGRILRRFSPAVFWPRPKVQSALLGLTPHPDRRLSAVDAPAFGRFVTALFTRRRKVIRTAFATAAPDALPEARAAALEAAGLDPTLRAQDVPPEALLAAWRALAST